MHLNHTTIWYHMHINILNLEFSPKSKCFCCFCTSNVSSIPSSPWNILCSVTIWTYSPCPAIPLCPESWWYTSSIHAIVHNSYIWDFANLKFIMNPWCEIQFSVQFHTLQHFNKSEVFNLYTWWFKIRTPGWSKTPMSRKVSCWPKPISGRTRLDRCLEKSMPRDVHGYQMRYCMLNLPKDPKDSLERWDCFLMFIVSMLQEISQPLSHALIGHPRPWLAKLYPADGAGWQPKMDSF